MIIDSSALVAIVLEEPHSADLLDAIYAAPSLVVPAPALTETQLVLGGRGKQHLAAIESLVSLLRARGVTIASFDDRHATITASAREKYGKGNGRGGLLNFADLMVYAIARQRGEPLLCTGRDFASTDLDIHPASRLDP